MNSRHKLEALMLICAAAISRLAFRSHDLYDLDSVNFALAMQRFDPRVHQPHPPGYFLYTYLGRLLNSLLHDANFALVVLSVAASCGAVFIIYSMTLDWFGQYEARFASLIFLCSPLIWFYGTVALTYSVEAFFSALLGYLCWRISCGHVTLITPAAIILGASAGVRPSSLLFFGPLYLLSLRNVKLTIKFLGMAAFVLTLSAWFLPMISFSGGSSTYFGALVSVWNLVPAKSTVFNSSPATSIARACTIAFIYLLSFGPASLATLCVLHRNTPVDYTKKIFTITWIAPALCFFTFIFLQFVNSGYLLLLAPPACIWLGYWAAKWYQNSMWRRPLKWWVIAICATVNILIFLVSPFYFSYRSVRQFETQLEDIRAIIPQLGSPDDILIIGFDSHFLGYRHAGYYLPHYLTIEYPAVKLEEGERIFAMRGQDTRLLAKLPVTSCSRFIFFPLPDGGVYRKYLEQVKKLLPAQSLRTVRAGGYDFVSAPIVLLPLLFPQMTTGRKGVYPPLHSGALDVNRREHQPDKEALPSVP